MVAYSFQQRFVEPIAEGTKVQTIRARRKRHARQGEELQLYAGMRTRHCKLIARKRCTGLFPIAIWPAHGRVVVGEGYPGVIVGERAYLSSEIGLTTHFETPVRFVVPCRASLAQADGFFTGWTGMQEFWLEEHEGLHDGGVFVGVLIYWGDRG